jgi:hypothetical protein
VTCRKVAIMSMTECSATPIALGPPLTATGTRAARTPPRLMAPLRMATTRMPVRTYCVASPRGAAFRTSSSSASYGWAPTTP